MTTPTATIWTYLSGDQLCLAGDMSTAVADTPASDLRLYGSPSRPMSGSWARIPDAAYITADYVASGYHTWVVVPTALPPATVESYELVCVV